MQPKWISLGLLENCCARIELSFSLNEIFSRYSYSNANQVELVHSFDSLSKEFSKSITSKNTDKMSNKYSITLGKRFLVASPNTTNKTSFHIVR